MWAFIRFSNSSTSAPKPDTGGGRIRTCEAVRRQIYSLLVLAAHPPLRSPRGDSNPLAYRLQIGCATVAPLGQLVHKYKICPKASQHAYVCVIMVTGERRAVGGWSCGRMGGNEAGDGGP